MKILGTQRLNEMSNAFKEQTTSTMHSENNKQR